MNEKELIQLNFNGILEPQLIQEIEEIGIIRKFDKDDIIIHQGETFKFLPLLLQGSLKVLKENDEGNEILLYHIEGGDTCAMAMNCCLSQHKSNIIAIAETDIIALFIPAEKINEWLIKYEGWRSFIFNSFNQRFDELLETIEDIAFRKLDERLWKYLIDKVKITGSTTLEISHKEIALDLNSSRVVISRLLKKLENDGRVKIGRNKIEVIDF